ncbi:unnamed protein product [Caenorhabditis sp. 36 PRJEB53466]|nr:unnamed protein product [Caenorhabditis sp. 36 PRJEB53466]
MVVSAEIIKKKAIFHVAWRFAVGEGKKLSRNEILDQDLPELCKSIVRLVPGEDGKPSQKAGLYLLSLLTYGTVLIHQTQVLHLFREAGRMKEVLLSSDFSRILCEEIIRVPTVVINEVETGQRKRKSRVRSKPILRVEDVDDVDLGDLNKISEQLGINGDVREITMKDALPNPSNNWAEYNALYGDLYGSVDKLLSQEEYSRHSTFVEGNGSDANRERANAIFATFDDYVLPHQPGREKQSIADGPRVQTVDELPAENEKSRVPEENGDDIRYSKCLLRSPARDDLQLTEQVQVPQEPMEIDNLRQDLQSLIPQEEQNQDQNRPQTPLMSSPEKLKNQPPAAKAQDTAETLPIRQPPPVDELDLDFVPPRMQQQVSAYLQQIANLPDESVALPPLPKNFGDEELFDEPLAKKQKVDGEQDEEDEEEVEKARRRASSRPVTPITPLNRTNLTNLDTTDKPEVASFELDSQVVIPRKKKSARNLPPVFGNDIEIDLTVQKASQADYSKLVRLLVIPKIISKSERIVWDLESPMPFIGLGTTKIAVEFEEVFHSERYKGGNPTTLSDSEEEEDEEEEELEAPRHLGEKFSSVCLVSTPQESIRLEEELRTPLFMDEFRPMQLDELFGPPQPGGPTKMLQDEPMDVELPPKEKEPEFFAKRYLVSTPPSSPKRRGKKENYAFRCLISTPEKRQEQSIMDQLMLQPIQEMLDLPLTDRTQREVAEPTPTVERRVEKARRHQKSSLGIRQLSAESVVEDTEGVQLRAEGTERFEARRRLMEEAMFANSDDKDYYVFSSGSLLPSYRGVVHEELLAKTRETYPNWVDFNQFTSKYNRKQAATAFEVLLLGLKNMKLRAKQEEPFGTIYAQHVEVE